jgi:lipoprotein signal peptidase
MNNIWKYSLVLAFSIIADQLIKGTAQSLLLEQNSTAVIWGSLSFARLLNPYLIFGINIPQLGEYQNLICHLIDLLLIIWILKKIIYFRNRGPVIGWGYTLWLMGIFTSWLDRVSHGYTLDYLSLQGMSFSLGDLYSIVGLSIICWFEGIKIKMRKR